MAAQQELKQACKKKERKRAEGKIEPTAKRLCAWALQRRRTPLGPTAGVSNRRIATTSRRRIKTLSDI